MGQSWFANGKEKEQGRGGGGLVLSNMGLRVQEPVLGLLVNQELISPPQRQCWWEGSCNVSCNVVYKPATAPPREGITGTVL